MKTIQLVFAVLVFSLCIRMKAQTNGYLVFEVSRVIWHVKGPEVKQKFKVPLTEEFMAQFKHLPNQHSAGTGFLCAGGELAGAAGGTRFAWWLQKTADHRWAINMWGEGAETMNGVQLSSRNPVASQYVTIKQLEDLDMTYQLSYEIHGDGLNVSFTAKYVPAKDIDADGPIPTVVVKKADGSELFKGGDSSKLPLILRGGFQEN